MNRKIRIVERVPPGAHGACAVSGLETTPKPSKNKHGYIFDQTDHLIEGYPDSAHIVCALSELPIYFAFHPDRERFSSFPIDCLLEQLELRKVWAPAQTAKSHHAGAASHLAPQQGGEQVLSFRCFVCDKMHTNVPVLASSSDRREDRSLSRSNPDEYIAWQQSEEELSQRRYGEHAQHESAQEHHQYADSQPHQNAYNAQREDPRANSLSDSYNNDPRPGPPTPPLQQSMSYEQRRNKLFPWYQHVSFMHDFVDWVILQARFMPSILIASIYTTLELASQDYL